MVVERESLVSQEDTAFIDEADRAGALTALLRHRAWTGFFVPMVRQTRAAATYLLVQPPNFRAPAMSDEYLRGRISVLDELLRIGPAVVAEWQAGFQLDQAALSYEQEFQERAELGHVGPLGG